MVITLGPETMPDSISLAAIAQLAIQLPPAEQRQLAETILQRLTAPGGVAVRPGRSWREVRGSVVFPLCGEDAQTHITRERSAAERQREDQRTDGR